MKKSIILIFVLMSCGCAKTRNCVDPAPGDTPMTVIQGIELGANINQILACPYVDTFMLYEHLSPNSFGLYHTAVGLIYDGYPSEMHLYFQKEGFDLLEAYISVLSEEKDTANARIVHDKLISNYTDKYGSPKKTLWPPYYDEFSKYFYDWQVCDGVNITIVGRTSYKGKNGYTHLPEEGDTAIRSVTIEFR